MLFMAMKAAGTWASILRTVFIVLLPKSEGGYRTIGLFPTLVRLWMRVRLGIAQMWQADNHRDYLYGGPGMSALMAAWKIGLHAENAASDDDDHAAPLLDLVKAFDKVPHDHLVRAARRLGYPIVLLILSLAAYRFPRRFVVRGI